MTWKDKLGDWGDVMSPLFSSKEFQTLQDTIKKDKLTSKVYPDGADTFKAFELCQLSEVKVVILGQDPYHNGQAIGVSFGVKSTPIPPSLKVITRELNAQYNYTPDEFDYSLTHWGKQGVLLFNTALSVVKDTPGSHSHLWTFFTTNVIKHIVKHKPNTIFVLWGKHAEKYKKYIPEDKVLISAHPAAEMYNFGRAGFFGNGHFVKIDEMLESKINWFTLPTQLTDSEQIQLYND
jgi:uracil-DNA glycosylase